MSKKVTIPTDGGNPFVVILGGIKYVYKPGETVEVPDGVALEIEEWERWRDKYRGAVQPPFAAGDGGSSVQPDLSQNDPNAADYVKGKEEFAQQIGGSNKVIVEKTFTIPAQSKMTRSAQSQGTKLSFHYLRLNESDLSCQYRLIDGETYTFKAPDGNVYSVLASRQRSDAAVGFFVATDTFYCEFEDTGSNTLPIVSIGDGLTVPTNTGQRNAFEYGISGKFEVARCLSRDTVDFSIASQALDQWNCINGVLVGLAALIGFVCCNDQWNATISKISYASGSSFDARMAYPLALSRSEDKGNIADAELDFMVWNTYSNQWHFLRADVLNGTVSELPQFPS